MKWILLATIVVLAGCDKFTSNKPVRIAINPWPGYEFLYLAKQKNIFEQFDLNIELVEMASLADVQRIYVQGRVDGMTSTVIELVHAAGQTEDPISIVLIPDYSNGGDVIVAHKSVQSIPDLKGKQVTAELGSLGMYVLYEALNKAGMELKDVQLDNSEQLEIESLLTNRKIDAAVTYPPASTLVLRNPDFHKIFDSSQIPESIIDIVAVKASVIKNDPEWVNKFHQAWGAVLEYARTHPEESYAIMAEREGTTANEFQQALEGLILLDKNEQERILSDGKIEKNVKAVCQVLLQSNAISFPCENALSKIKVWNP
ncbi:ABC transporter substrate-binding protein [Vibrio profundum]|uniref:ABC transporter substrate-binding protein n=1 Tax=Vibrio profundum TaxID=2910247 RepID=UPI003D136376